MLRIYDALLIYNEIAELALHCNLDMITCEVIFIRAIHNVYYDLVP